DLGDVADGARANLRFDLGAGDTASGGSSEALGDQLTVSTGDVGANARLNLDVAGQGAGSIVEAEVGDVGERARLDFNIDVSQAEGEAATAGGEVFVTTGDVGANARVGVDVTGTAAADRVDVTMGNIDANARVDLGADLGAPISTGEGGTAAGDELTVRAGDIGERATFNTDVSGPAGRLVDVEAGDRGANAPGDVNTDPN